VDPISARPDRPPGPYLVAGLRRAGLAAARRLVALAGADAVTAWDGRSSDALCATAGVLQREGVRLMLGGDGLRLLEGPAPPNCVVKSPGIPPTVPLLVQARRRGIAVIDELELGWRVDGRPVIAVTGTNGKSTVASLAVALLRAAGARPALAGNVHPGPPFTALAPEDGDVVVCEASSFQLEKCPAFLPEVAVFTNLTHEHLDRHLTMRRYGAAKRRMFVRGPACAPVAVVNVDDSFGADLAEEVRDLGGTVLRFGEGGDADYRLAGCRWGASEGWLLAETPCGPVEMRTRLPGRHNALNALAALALADALDLPRSTSAATIGSAPGVPGRFELIDGDQRFDVIVDYAHNPDGLRRILEAGRGLLIGRRARARLRVVCCAPRIRNEHQRRMMGRIAASLADRVVLTNERRPATDAATELPAGFAEGARDGPNGRCEIVLDRAEAIERAVRAASDGDVVMILGRGELSDELLDRDGRPAPFDDREAARRALARIGRAPQRA
jgi:UDP-N-acetylmuramoyl-L-alanyl-D-glutamate--2,6-diaminopimelate ligase